MATAEELALLVGGTIKGDGSVQVSGVAAIGDALPGDVVLAESSKYFATALESEASVIVCSSGEGAGKTLIRVKDEKKAFADILQYFAPKQTWGDGIDASCRIGGNFACGSDVSIGYGSYVGDDVTLGDGVILGPQVYVGDDVKIGSGSLIWPQVVVHWGTEIGQRVTIYSGTVIGADGFGYVQVEGIHRKIPQIGGVVIEDDVEIGANTTIDRAKTGETRIGQGTKVDNLVMIAHNVKIGKNCIILAQVGISGSVNIGDNVIVTGQAGFKDHVTVGDNAILAGRAGVMSNVPAGSVVMGYPARDRMRHWRIEAALERLPDLVKAVRKLENEIRQLGQ